MRSDQEIIESRLLPKVARRCKETAQGGGNPEAKHVISTPLEWMRVATVCEPEHPDGMDFRCASTAGHPTHRQLLYELRTDVLANVWGLWFRGDPQNRGEAIEWTAHQVIGPRWQVNRVTSEAASGLESCDALMVAGIKALPNGNTQLLKYFRREIGGLLGSVNRVRKLLRSQWPDVADVDPPALTDGRD